MLPQSPQPTAFDRRLTFGLRLAALVGALVVLGLLVEGTTLIVGYQLGQAALDEAALAAASAVEADPADGALTLRLEDAEGRPSAYTLAQSALDGAGARQVQLTEVVSDGARVFVRGQLSLPTVWLWAFGLPAIQTEAVSSAELFLINRSFFTPAP